MKSDMFCLLGCGSRLTVGNVECCSLLTAKCAEQPEHWTQLDVVSICPFVYS